MSPAAFNDNHEVARSEVRGLLREREVLGEGEHGKQRQRHE
jgi:hypothetical protein